MSQFGYLNEINNLLSMDGDLSRGPAPRWQKKLDASAASISFNGSMNASKKLSISYNGYAAEIKAAGNKTPNKLSSEKNKKTPKSGKFFFFCFFFRFFKFF